MGMFDTYGNVQLKVGGHRSLFAFNVGDLSPLDDGIYIGWEGGVAIVGFGGRWHRPTNL